MSDRIRVAGIGAVIEIDASGRGSVFAQRVREAWSDALAPAEAQASDVVTVRADLDDEAALAMLSTDVTLAALQTRRGEALWMLHAAGLADDAGRVVVLSAPSGTGKTTAARHLSQRYAYVSDETVGVSASGDVVAYRKPLSVIEQGAAHKVQVAPSRLHAAPTLPGALRVAAIVVLDRRDDGPLRPEVERLDLAVALELLAPQTSYLSDMPAPLHVVGDLLDLVGGAVRIRYREAAELDAVIDELLRAEPSTSKAPRAPRTPGEAAVPAEPGTYARTPVIDALDFGDGRLAVLRRSDTGSRVHVLDGIGPAIWEAASGRTLTELTAGVVAAHGQPDGVDPEVLVDAAVQALVADDLLTSAPAHT